MARQCGDDPVPHLDRSESRIEVDSLVTSTTNVAMDLLARDLRARGMAFIEIGDGVSLPASALRDP